ncbi:hypothetical protein, partial [Frankia sp. CiP3]|uniref:hypothetical protein n=1 Tax=Frankia sp. CiP3 TaxID=2880971 RepID=UPI001EF4EEA2
MQTAIIQAEEELCEDPVNAVRTRLDQLTCYGQKEYGSKARKALQGSFKKAILKRRQYFSAYLFGLILLLSIRRYRAVVAPGKERDRVVQEVLGRFLIYFSAPLVILMLAIVVLVILLLL